MMPLLLLLIATLSWAPAESNQIAKQASAPVARLVVRIPARTTLKEPIVAGIEIENLSDEQLDVDLGLDEKTNFVFRQLRPGGASVVERPKAPSNGVAFLKSSSIDAHQRWSSEVVLDEWLRFDQLGSYTVEISFVGRIQTRAGAAVQLDAARSQSVVVEPRDVAVLRQRCEEWLRRASSERTRAGHDRALKPLQYVIDPVAVSYLQEAIERYQWWPGFGSLGKIGGPEAKPALERLAKSSNSTTAKMAASVLVSVYGKGLDVMRRRPGSNAHEEFAADSKRHAFIGSSNMAWVAG